MCQELQIFAVVYMYSGALLLLLLSLSLLLLLLLLLLTEIGLSPGGSAKFNKKIVPHTT